MGLAPTPTVPVDPLLQQFLRAVEAFEAAPTIDRLRELERMGTQLMARLRELGPAALVLLRDAVARILAVLASPTVVVWGGAIIGAGLMWWAFFTMLSEKIKLPDPAAAVDAVTAAIKAQLFEWGIEFWNKAFKRCWDAFKEGLEDLISRAGGMKEVLGHPVWQNKYELLIAALLKCLLGDMAGLTVGMRQKLGKLIRDMLMAAGLLGAAGLGAAGTAEAGQGPDPQDHDLAEAIKKLGLTGIPRGDGFGYCESLPPEEEAGGEVAEGVEYPCVPMPWEVDLRVDLPLSGFSDAELAMRKAILDCWITYFEGLIREDRAALREGDDDTDSRREDMLRLRLQMNRAELERLRRARQNVDRERQLRDLRRTPTELAPPLVSRLKFRFPSWNDLFD